MKGSPTTFRRVAPAVLVSLGLGAAVWAQRLCPWPTDTAPLKESLGLSTAQEKKVATLGHNFREEAKPLSEKMTKQRQELMTLWKAEKPDRDKIEAKTQEMDATRAELRTACLDYQFAVRDLLTAAQRKKLASGAMLCQGCCGGMGCGMMGGPGAGMGMRGMGMGPGGGRGMGMRRRDGTGPYCPWASQ